MIRRMTETDIPAAAELERKYFSVPWSEKSLRESLGQPSYLFLVAEEQGKIVGYAGMLKIQDEGDITNIVVEDACRGKGLGKALTEGLLEAGSECGIRAFTLEVRVSNAPAIHIYEQLGFVSAGIRKHFYEKPAEDALIMWKREPET